MWGSHTKNMAASAEAALDQCGHSVRPLRVPKELDAAEAAQAAQAAEEAEGAEEAEAVEQQWPGRPSR